MIVEIWRCAQSPDANTPHRTTRTATKHAPVESDTPAAPTEGLVGAAARGGGGYCAGLGATTRVGGGSCAGWRGLLRRRECRFCTDGRLFGVQPSQLDSSFTVAT